MRLSPSCYSFLTNMLLGLANGRMAVLLEGGYFPPSLAESAALTLGALLGDQPPPNKMHSFIKESTRVSVLSCIYLLRPFWKCFGHFDVYPNECAVDIENIPHMAINIQFAKSPDFIEAPPYPTRDYYIKNTDEENKKFGLYMESIKIGTTDKDFF